ncbi:hypothetical protein OG607_39305 [Streptomyces sp. NBC_01537]
MSVEQAALLAIWEAGASAGGSSAHRALLLHSAARPAAGLDELRSVPVGERDADLYALRSRLFGERMEVRVTCESCSEEMEFGFGTGEVIRAAAPVTGPLEIEADGWSVRFRLPTTGDLAAVEDAADPRAALVARCVLEAVRAGKPAAPDRLPERVRRLVARTAAEADPCADVTLKVECPQCGHQASAELDIVSYLWAELDAWARGILLDIHLLASAYGWSEPEILALSPLRRRYYLELCADA